MGSIGNKNIVIYTSNYKTDKIGFIYGQFGPRTPNHYSDNDKINRENSKK